MFLSQLCDFPLLPSLAGKKKLDDSPRHDAVEIACVPDMFPSLFPSIYCYSTYQHEAITSRSHQLLMMGTWLPKTC
jgi:hypothetical protein